MMLYEYKGNLGPQSKDWEFCPSENAGGTTYNPAEGYYPDKGGKLIGPIIPGIKEFCWYNMKFEAECEQDCHWAVVFYKPDGETLVSDVYSSIYAGRQKYSVMVYGREEANAMRPFFQSVSGVKVQNLTIEQVDEMEVAKWCDMQYKALPPYSYDSPEPNMSLLPKTLTALKSGKPWRVVMLGDSIVNDTFNSGFQALIKRIYPESQVKWLCSVRGSTGCWFYQGPDQFNEYVTRLKPDLLFIGGVSQRFEKEPVRNVIDMAKKQIGCEIVLSSPPLGNVETEKEQTEFSLELQKVAKETGIEFIDLRKPWNYYTATCRKPQNYYYRDAVHGNDRGKQIAGRILANHLSHSSIL